MGDGVIRGYLVSVQAGSAAKRFVIGFSAGSSEIDTVVETYVMTPEGLRELGSGRLSSSGSKTPGIIVPAAAAIATRNPIGLIIVGATRIYGEASGSNTPEGRAKAVADAIAEQLKIRFREQRLDKMRVGLRDCASRFTENLKLTNAPLSSRDSENDKQVLGNLPLARLDPIDWAASSAVLVLCLHLGRASTSYCRRKTTWASK